LAPVEKRLYSPVKYTAKESPAVLHHLQEFSARYTAADKAGGQVRFVESVGALGGPSQIPRNRERFDASIIASTNHLSRNRSPRRGRDTRKTAPSGVVSRW